MKLHRQAHVVYKTQYHIFWVTRYRRKILTGGIAQFLKVAIKEVRKVYPDWYMEEIGIASDHVHLYMVIPPKYSVSKVVGVIKSVTSKRLREKFSHFLRKVYWDNKGVWARGFFVSTVGINEATIRRYIRFQGEQDAGQAELEL
jgi:putative transposase